MRTLLLTAFASLVLFSCGKPEMSGKGNGVFVYSGDGSEWDTDAVPGAPAQSKPVFSNHPRPSLQQAASLSPTVYYTPKIELGPERVSGCKLVGAGDWSICEATLKNCIMQGSCFIGFGNSWRYFMKAKTDTIVPRSPGRCRFGVGFGSCLTPYVSVAADLKVHQVGDVIYVPDLDGKNVPYIGRHDGFLIVHDKGGAIVGANRFDFFTGHMGSRDQRNAFARWGYGSKNHGVAYVKLSAGEAAAVKREKGLN